MYLLSNEKINLSQFLYKNPNDPGEHSWQDTKIFDSYGYTLMKIRTVIFDNVTLQSGNDLITDFHLEMGTPYNISFLNLDTSKVKSIRISCNCVKQLDLNQFDTSSLEYFSFMDCYLMEVVDITGWNTSKVTSLENAFYGCSNLMTIKGIENLDTSNVTSLKNTFKNCHSIEFLPLYKWDTSKVTTMYSTFEYCSRLMYLPISYWNTPNLRDVSHTFEKCNNLTAISLTNWTTNNINQCYRMIYESYNLKTWYYDRNWDNYVLGTRDDIFYLSSLEGDFTHRLYPNRLTHVSKAIAPFDFDILQKLKELYELPGTGSGRHQGYDVTEEVHFITFKELPSNAVCKFITQIRYKLPVYIYAEMSDTPISFGENSYTFPKKLYFVSEGKIDISGLYDSTKGRFMPFDDSTSFFNPDAYNFDNAYTNNMTSMKNMFANCDNLSELDLSNFNTSQVTDMSGMFFNCSSLETIYVSDKWDVGYVTSSFEMFAHCEKLKGDIEYKDSNPNDKTNATTTRGYLTYVPPE